MRSSLALTTLRAVSARAAAPMAATASARTTTRALIVQAAAARYVTTRFMSLEKPYACDAPDGDHDFQDLVRFVKPFMHTALIC